MKNSLKFLLTLSVFAFAFTSCDEDDDAGGTLDQTATFEVTLENVSSSTFFASGKTGAIPPGMSASFDFYAAEGMRFHWAAMYVQTNDVFISPMDQEGVELYDAMGNALTGDITSMFALWDAGTEVNQMPGTGADQAPRQSGPNTGTAENGVVRPLSTVPDGFAYDNLSDAVTVTLAHDGAEKFTITVANTSDAMGVLNSPVSPGVWAVTSTAGLSLFKNGEAASAGLEDIAEDGANDVLGAVLADGTSLSTPFSPGAYAVYATGSTNPLFQNGQAASAGLEAIAEDGNVGVISPALGSTAGIFNTPVGASAAGPIASGGSYNFTITANNGDRLSLVTMLVQSNDLFIAPSSGGIELFPNGTAIGGDVTSMFAIWDAGTEVNEFPGAGGNQVIRQGMGGDIGPDENGVVRPEDDAFSYPAVSDLIKITITKQ